MDHTDHIFSAVRIYTLLCGIKRCMHVYFTAFLHNQI